MRVYLLGYMGSGKTTFGPKLAKALNIPFYDLDEVFEVRYRISISDFFTKYGEKYFRKIESDLLREISLQDDYILATGGGTPCFNENMEFMLTNGITVYLRLSPEKLSQRLKLSPKKRPVLKGLGQQNFVDQLDEHLQERETYYLQSLLVIDGNQPDPEKVAQVILQSAHLSRGE